MRGLKIALGLLGAAGLVGLALVIVKRVRRPANPTEMDVILFASDEINRLFREHALMTGFAPSYTVLGKDSVRLTLNREAYDKVLGSARGQRAWSEVRGRILTYARGRDPDGRYVHAEFKTCRDAFNCDGGSLS